MNATSIALKYIYCGHYRLTDHQARMLCKKWGGVPRDGHARILNPADLGEVTLLVQPAHEGGKWTASARCSATQARTAEVLRTPLDWHDGEPVNRGWTWALHLS